MAGFKDQLAAFAAKTKTDVDTVVRKVTLDIAAALDARSPVDTGRFRNNWMLGIGAPNTATTTATSGGGLTATVAGVAGVKAGGVAYLTNSLSYARVLEFGRSNGSPGSLQAPGGLVRITAIEFSQYIKKALAA